jgi:hypothetical protein
MHLTRAASRALEVSRDKEQKRPHRLRQLARDDLRLLGELKHLRRSNSLAVDLAYPCSDVC